MHRSDNSHYLLYLEPKKEEKLSEPIEDDITLFIQMLLENTELENDWSKTKVGISYYSDLKDNGTFTEGSAWRGCHTTECGETSTNHDYKLFNGMVTNSLAPFYLKWYRNSVPKSEWLKLKQLTEDFKSFASTYNTIPEN